MPPACPSGARAVPHNYGDKRLFIAFLLRFIDVPAIKNKFHVNICHKFCKAHNRELQQMNSARRTNENGRGSKMREILPLAGLNASGPPT
jgi:hypothetical protein